MPALAEQPGAYAMGGDARAARIGSALRALVASWRAAEPVPFGVWMKRDPALISLSRDHHQALSVALRLRRATAETATDVRADALRFWTTAGRAHFRLEEEVLLPAYARHGDPHHPLVARALCDHVAIRQRMDTLARDALPDVAGLRELGTMLSDHVRLEERELFVLIEQTLPTAALAALVGALQH